MHNIAEEITGEWLRHIKKCEFVEYIDIIKSPYFLFLYALSSSKEDKILKEPFDTEVIRNIKDPDDLATWYYSRKNQNPLFDLIPEDRISVTNFDKVDEFMDIQIRDNPILIDGSSQLNFVHVIRSLMTDSILVPKVYIWYPYDNPNVKSDVDKLFENKNVEFVHGDISKCLKDISNDSTFVFSDITNILVLEELGKLDMSSILLPVDFKYNLDEDENRLINIEQLQNDHTFKVNYFVATSN